MFDIQVSERNPHGWSDLSSGRKQNTVDDHLRISLGQTGKILDELDDEVFFVRVTREKPFFVRANSM